MIRHRILAVGRKSNDPLEQAAEGYLKRLGHYARAELIRVRQSTAEAEGQQLIKKIQPHEMSVILDERGEELTTRQLARCIKDWERDGTHDACWIVGGADGLAPAVKTRAQRSVALSKLTLPHRLALVVLLEQLYRAHSLLRGEPYHRD